MRHMSGFDVERSARTSRSSRATVEATVPSSTWTAPATSPEAAAGDRRRARLLRAPQRERPPGHLHARRGGDRALRGRAGEARRFLGAPSPETIVFTRGTTESINLVAHGWGRKFLAARATRCCSPRWSTTRTSCRGSSPRRRPGAALRYIPLTDDGLLDLSDLGSLLTERTKILAVTGMSNALGTITPLRQLIDAAHAVGAIVLVDGAQLVPHHAVDVVDARRATSSTFSRPQDARPDRLGRSVRQAPSSSTRWIRCSAAAR